MPRRLPSLANWSELLGLVVRAHLRRMCSRLGLISPEREVTLIEAHLFRLQRLRAVACGEGGR